MNIPQTIAQGPKSQVYAIYNGERVQLLTDGSGYAWKHGNRNVPDYKLERVPNPRSNHGILYRAVSIPASAAASAASSGSHGAASASGGADDSSKASSGK